MAKGHTPSCTVIRRAVLFFRIGVSTFTLPFLEQRHGLKDLFAVLSKRKDRYPCDKDTIRDFVHDWMRIKGLIKEQHCWNRTLLLYKFLKSAGYPVALYAGLRKDAITGTSILGHSWITVDGVIFDDRLDIASEHYITFHYP